MNGLMQTGAGRDHSRPRGAPMRAPPRVVVVTPSHLSANPRVLKEADALAEGGFDVHVVFGQRTAGAARDHDAALLVGRRWSWTAVRSARTSGEMFRWSLSVARQRAFQIVPPVLWKIGEFAEQASGRVLWPLARAAIKQRADLYIGHYPEGLAAAGIAATKTGTMLGYDAEDFHTGEANSPAELARYDFLQRRYLPRCSWVTAGSEGIARALAATYAIKEPITIH